MWKQTQAEGLTLGLRLHHRTVLAPVEKREMTKEITERLRSQLHHAYTHDMPQMVLTLVEGYKTCGDVQRELTEVVGAKAAKLFAQVSRRADRQADGRTGGQAGRHAGNWPALRTSASAAIE